MSLLLKKLSSVAEQTATVVDACPEGEVLSLKDRTCETLTKSFGFSQAAFDAATVGASEYTITKADCDDVNTDQTQKFKDYLEDIRSDGLGVLIIDECLIEFDAPVYIPANTLIRGAGTGKTTLHVTGWPEVSPGVPQKKGFFRIEKEVRDVRPGVQNVVVEDLSFTIDSSVSQGAFNTFLLWDAENVLVQRVDLHDSPNSNININTSQKMTFRHIYSAGSYSHNIGTKDCVVDPNDISAFDTITVDELVSKEECEDDLTNSMSFYWTNDLLIHSSVFSESESMGIDNHGSNVEIAGNLVVSNRQGSKFPEPATGVWVHHNLFKDNELHAVELKTQLCGTFDNTMQSKNHVFYYNDFVQNGLSGSEKQAFRINDVKNVVLLHNGIHIGNGKDNKVRIGDDCEDVDAPRNSSVTSCEDNDSIGDNGWSEAPGNNLNKVGGNNDMCDINEVADPFQHL